MTELQNQTEPPQRCLAIFAKYWEPGKSKTRLAATIGDSVAAELGRCFLIHLLTRFRAEFDARTLVYSPDDQHDAFRALSEQATIGNDAWNLVPQGTGSLGQRMERFLSHLLTRRGTKVILIGSDMPTITKERIEEAWDALDHHPVVIGPAEDGGYYLLGATGQVPPIFSGISWGTSDVLRQTEALLAQHLVTYHLLPSGYDVDHLEDLRRLSSELACLPPSRDPADTHLREAVQAALQ
jgi:uncharacterized protein